MLIFFHGRFGEGAVEGRKVDRVDSKQLSQTSVHTALNPVLVSRQSLWNLTTMEVPVLVKGPGMEGPRLSPLPLK